MYINHNKGLIMKLINEPTNEQIDDYNNNESPEKRKTVRIIIATLILVGFISYVVLKITNPMPSDYIGTTQEPGIVSTKVF